MSKWTQDPTYPRIIIDEDRQAICEIFGDSAKQAESFTRLIAEAPAMAELLLSIVNNGRVSNEELADAQAILERINK